MKMSKLFVIGDTHFLHSNIVKYTGRDEMFNTLLIQNWNKVVGSDDMVIHLGDLSAGVGDRKELLYRMVNKLNGNRILIRGNHDHMKAHVYKDEMGFDEVFSELILDDVLFTHYPLEITQYSSPKEKIRVEHLRKMALENDVNYIVHGHTHNRDTGIPGHYNCSCERLDLTPIELGIFLEGEINGKIEKV